MTVPVPAATGRAVRVKHRAAGGRALLLVLFLALVCLQLVVGERLRAGHAARADRSTREREANRAVLQYLTDAETGVRGFQLTGGREFLEPYASGRAGAFSALDDLAAGRPGNVEQTLLGVERQAAVRWLVGYAIPLVNAGVADADRGRAERGKQMFDRIRTANADVEAAIETGRDRTAAADRDAEQLVRLLSAVLTGLIPATALGVAGLYRRPRRPRRSRAVGGGPAPAGGDPADLAEAWAAGRKMRSSSLRPAAGSTAGAP